MEIQLEGEIITMSQRRLPTDDDLSTNASNYG